MSVHTVQCAAGVFSPLCGGGGAAAAVMTHGAAQHPLPVGAQPSPAGLISPGSVYTDGPPPLSIRKPHR